MCIGVAIFANNKKAIYGKKTNSHTKSAEALHINEDDYWKYEYHWWAKEIVDDHYDQVGKDLLKHIDKDKADKHVADLVKKHFRTQEQLAKWLKNVPDEWGHLMEDGQESLAKKVNPNLIEYKKKLKSFKYTDKKFNPYQATKLPSIKELRQFKKLDQVRAQVGAQVRAQVGDQVWDQVWAQVGDQVWAQVRAQVGDQVWAQVRDQVWAQVRAQVGDPVGDQVYSTSYWAIKVQLGLPIKHWFFDFLKLGVMIVLVKGKVKIFGKEGIYLGEYDETDLKL